MAVILIIVGTLRTFPRYIEKRMVCVRGGIEIRGIIDNCPDHSNTKIGKDIKKNLGELRRLYIYIYIYFFNYIISVYLCSHHLILSTSTYTKHSITHLPVSITVSLFLSLYLSQPFYFILRKYVTFLKWISNTNYITELWNWWRK